VSMRGGFHVKVQFWQGWLSFGEVTTSSSSLLSCSWAEEPSLPPPPLLAMDLLAWGRSSVSSTSSGPSW